MWAVAYAPSSLQRTASALGMAQSCLAPIADCNSHNSKRMLIMGRGILLWMLGVPLPVILLLAMCSHS